MAFPSFERLARLYQQRMLRLFHGGLLGLLDNPSLADTPEFRAEAWKVAAGMAREVAKSNAVSWREAAMKSTRAREIYAALRREIERTGLDLEINRIAVRNARLISSLPQDIAQHITAYSAKQHQEGARPEEIEREIRKMAPRLARNRIRLIARTEISKAETGLTVTRAENMGVEWGQWLTSEDQRVRPSHKNLDKVLMRWDEPPQPEALIGEKSSLGRGLAGEFPNCRCLMSPLVSLEEVKWPAKVYRAGSITRMTRAQFTRLTPMRIAA